MTTGKTIALTRQTFVGKVISLLFNMLSRLVIAFLPRRKHLLISCLQSPSAVILEPPKIKTVTVSIVSPSICHEVIEIYLQVTKEKFQLAINIITYPTGKIIRTKQVNNEIIFLHLKWNTLVHL